MALQFTQTDGRKIYTKAQEPSVKYEISTTFWFWVNEWRETDTDRSEYIAKMTHFHWWKCFQWYRQNRQRIISGLTKIFIFLFLVTLAFRRQICILGYFCPTLCFH